jgi:DNA-binding NarL/FixJ family response regulator
MMVPLRIFLVDDHKIIRDGIRAMLLGNPKFRVVGTAGDAIDFFDQLNEAKPDICVLDVQLPGKSGIEIAEILKSQYPHIRILILTALKEDAPVQQCRELEVEGMISKDSGKETYLEALTALSEGKSFYAGQFTELLIQSQANQKSINGLLSVREIEFLVAFTKGLSHKEIADTLHISPRTVEVHKKNVMEKLKLTNTVELIKYAIKEGLITI